MVFKNFLQVDNENDSSFNISALSGKHSKENKENSDIVSSSSKKNRDKLKEIDNRDYKTNVIY